MNISNNLFLNNTSEEGGGITYNKGKPLLLSNNTFKYNFAYYGLNVSSFPIRVNLTNQNHENIFFLDAIRPSIDDYLFKNIDINYIDEDNQIVNSSIIDGFFYFFL